MSDEKLTTLYSYRLVKAIEETRKQPLHPSVQEAFLHVPRHLFVDAYYQGNEHVSAPVAHDEESWHHWLAQIYCDEALVTQRDEHGMPTSSSSQPSVMAGMLEALDLHTGQTVLEIGTGTGYNGERLLWSDLLHAYQDWLAYGKPGLKAYTLYIDQSNRQVIRSNEYQAIARTFPLTDEGVLS